MKNALFTFALVLAFLLTFLATESEASQMKETRYTVKIKRDKLGRILRRADVLSEFRKIHPCPSTGSTTSKCPGWAVDHVIPLACYGKDSVSNMQWLPLTLKTCPSLCKDRWERLIYAPQGRKWRYCVHP